MHTFDFPAITRLRRRFHDQPEAADAAAAVRDAILASDIRDRVPVGGTVAVTVGSRGIRAIDVLARAAVDTLRSMGFRPFIVAAMGSHGGGTA